MLISNADVFIKCFYCKFKHTNDDFMVYHLVVEHLDGVQRRINNLIKRKAETLNEIQISVNLTEKDNQTDDGTSKISKDEIEPYFDAKEQKLTSVSTYKSEGQNEISELNFEDVAKSEIENEGKSVEEFGGNFVLKTDEQIFDHYNEIVDEIDKNLKENVVETRESISSSHDDSKLKLTEWSEQMEDKANNKLKDRASKYKRKEEVTFIHPSKVAKQVWKVSEIAEIPQMYRYSLSGGSSKGRLPDNKTIVCDYCEAEFVSIKGAETHMCAIKHGIYIPEDVPLKEIPIEMFCKTCTAENKCNPHICKICDFSYKNISSVSNLRIHFKSIHMGGKLEGCNICGNLVKNIAAHKFYSHGGLQKYKCQFCPYRSRNNNSIVFHMRSNHQKDGVVPCKFRNYPNRCRIAFFDKKSMLKHYYFVHDKIEKFPQSMPRAELSYLKRGIPVFQNFDGQNIPKNTTILSCGYENCLYQSSEHRFIVIHRKKYHIDFDFHEYIKKCLEDQK